MVEGLQWDMWDKKQQDVSIVTFFVSWSSAHLLDWLVTILACVLGE
jgi:hypothetical protein